MINVTLGEAKPQEKPFPKLMIRKDNDDYTLIFALSKSGDSITGVTLATNYERDFVGDYGYEFNASVFSDYNEPITLQNA